jgi:hypothetical protein
MGFKFGLDVFGEQPTNEPATGKSVVISPRATTMEYAIALTTT